jgi:hypothetical protein
MTGREIRLRKTCKTERATLIELGKLLEQAAAGRQPETNATVSEPMDEYAKVCDRQLAGRARCTARGPLTACIRNLGAVAPRNVLVVERDQLGTAGAKSRGRRGCPHGADPSQPALMRYPGLSSCRTPAHNRGRREIRIRTQIADQASPRTGTQPALRA